MAFPIQPIFLLADSQLLFWREDGEFFLERVRSALDSSEPRAAYVGASNGDRQEFFQLFREAMATVGIDDCRLIPSEPSDEDLGYFDAADVILLAGGDVRLGWRTMKKNGLQQKVIERYYSGAVLMGVSAGAMQLGLHGIGEDSDGETRLIDTFKLVPLLVDVHSEPDWSRLRKGLTAAEEPVRALGIPSGAGAVLHPDMTLEAVRRPLVELHGTDDGFEESLLIPPGSEDEVKGDPPADA